MIKINAGSSCKYRPFDISDWNNNGYKGIIFILINEKENVLIGNKNYELNPGSMILLKKTTIIFKGNKKSINNWISFENGIDLITKLDIPIDVPVVLDSTNAIVEILYMIIKELECNGKNKKTILNNYMNILLYKIAENIKGVNISAKDKYILKKIGDLREEIYNCPEKKWTVNSMCSFIGISPSYLQHLYKELYNVSCINDVIDARIKKAERLLQDSKKTMINISQECGYESEIHFSRQFKNETGVSPRNYRKLITGEKSESQN